MEISIDCSFNRQDASDVAPSTHVRIGEQLVINLPLHTAARFVLAARSLIAVIVASGRTPRPGSHPLQGHVSHGAACWFALLAFTISWKTQLARLYSWRSIIDLHPPNVTDQMGLRTVIITHLVLLLVMQLFSARNIG